MTEVGRGKGFRLTNSFYQITGYGVWCRHKKITT